MIWYIIIGFFVAILSGLGVGGGVLLVPILSEAFNHSQLECQIISLVTFIPMAIAATIMNIKNKQIDLKSLYIVIPFGIAGALCGSFLAAYFKGEILKKLYGGFLLFYGIIQLLSCRDFIIKKFKKASNILIKKKDKK